MQKSIDESEVWKQYCSEKKPKSDLVIIVIILFTSPSWWFAYSTTVTVIISIVNPYKQQ